MLARITILTGASLSLAMIAFPAFAVVPPVQVPEPSTLALMSGSGVIAGAAYAVSRWIKRK